MPTPGAHYEIAIRVRTIMQLFNSLDPSPFRERDLDPHTEEFVVGWARELPRGALFAIVIEMPAEEAARPDAAGIARSFRQLFPAARGSDRPRIARTVPRRLALAADRAGRS